MQRRAPRVGLQGCSARGYEHKGGGHERRAGFQRRHFPSAPAPSPLLCFGTCPWGSVKWRSPHPQIRRLAARGFQEAPRSERSGALLKAAGPRAAAPLARADSRRPGAGLAPRPQALPMPAAALVLYTSGCRARLHFFFSFRLSL
jgi:hypothetical protein